MLLRKLLFFFNVTALFGCGFSVKADVPIQLYYEERAPYAVSGEPGVVYGLTATVAADALNKAGILFEWKSMPFKRQIATIRSNKRNACGIGWFKKPEREEFARFSDVIYQDKPSIIISSADNDLIGEYAELGTLLASKSLKMLVKDSFSYGPYIDAQIKKYYPQTITVVNSTNIQMLQMILAGRADYLFSSEEEAKHMISSARFAPSQFRFHFFEELPAGNKRYIACSQQVPAEIIERINRALK